MLNIEFIDYITPFFLLFSLFIFIFSKQKIINKRFGIVFLLLYIIPGILNLLKLYSLKYEWILSFVLLLQFNDNFALIFGKKFGKYKIFQKISPNKTLEGYLFGALGICIGIVILHTIIPILKGNSIYQDSVLALYIMFFSNSGDLILSKIKRSFEIKDFSNLLPGHGGILDRIDNVLFAAPGFLLLIKYGII